MFFEAPNKDEQLKSDHTKGMTEDSQHQTKVEPKHVEDEMLTAQQVAVKTQQRQLHELDELDALQSLTEEMKELKQAQTVLQFQLQQPAAEEHQQGEYCCLT